MLRAEHVVDPRQLEPVSRLAARYGRFALVTGESLRHHTSIYLPPMIDPNEFFYEPRYSRAEYYLQVTDAHQQQAWQSLREAENDSEQKRALLAEAWRSMTVLHREWLMTCERVARAEREVLAIEEEVRLRLERMKQKHEWKDLTLEELDAS